MTEQEKRAVLEYMAASRRGPGYMGYAQCRLCGVNLGDCDMTTPDGRWEFPEKWEHYILEHGLRPTVDAFIESALAWATNRQGR